jgi:hypothetical protein
MKTMEVSMKKIILAYSVGFLSAYLLPNKYFFNIMNFQHEIINESIVVRDREKYIRID